MVEVDKYQTELHKC